MRGTNEQNTKLGQKGQESVTWPNFEILGPPPYLRNSWSFNFGMHIDHEVH